MACIDKQMLPNMYFNFGDGVVFFFVNFSVLAKLSLWLRRLPKNYFSYKIAFSFTVSDLYFFI